MRSEKKEHNKDKQERQKEKKWKVEINTDKIWINLHIK